MTSKTITKIIITLFVLVPLGLFVSSLWFKAHHSSITELHGGTALPQAKALPAFELKDMNDQPFNNQNLKGQWTLLFFGFTRCPAVCPTTLAELVQATKILKEQGGVIPQVAFISIDPHNDSAHIIKNYLLQFNPNFIGATGTQEQLEILSKSMGVMFSSIPLTRGYTMAHSDLILVINPKGEWAAVLTPPHKASDIATDFSTIQDQS